MEHQWRDEFEVTEGQENTDTYIQQMGTYMRDKSLHKIFSRYAVRRKMACFFMDSFLLDK